MMTSSTAINTSHNVARQCTV